MLAKNGYNAILSKALGMLMRMDHYHEGPEPGFMYNLSTPDTKSYFVSSPYNFAEGDTSLPIPLMGKPAIFKSHETKRLELLMTNRRTTTPGSISGVIRLARNPGDQILRNVHRWTEEAKQARRTGDEIKEEYFRKMAILSCADVRNDAKSWLTFHNFWNKFDSTPQIIYHYENFSNSAKVEQSTKKVLEFLKKIEISKESPTLNQNSTTDENGIYGDIGERIDGIVKDSSYKHGTLLTEICGKDMALELHRITKDITEVLGYEFDEESATWSLPISDAKILYSSNEN